MKTIKIRKESEPSTVVEVKYCESFLEKLIGLMFSKEISRGQGIILVEKKESRINSAIHMLFMNFNITVLWLDAQKRIVDKVLAKKWVPIYIPQKPSQYILELHPSRFSDFLIGEALDFFESQ